MKNKIILFIFLSFLVFFFVLLFAESHGYYKNKNEKAKILTETQIKNFEKDISEGKEIDLKKYVLYEDKDYSNKLSTGIYKISLGVEKIFDKTIKIVFNKMGDYTSN